MALLLFAFACSLLRSPLGSDALLRPLLLAAFVSTAPSVFAFAGAGSIPHGYVYPGYNGAGSHAFVPSGEAKFWQGVARTTGFVDAAGKTAATSAVISRVAGAGRYVWAACSANIVVCAGGVAFAAYMMQSNIQQDPQTGQWGKWNSDPGLYEYFFQQWYTSLGSACGAYVASSNRYASEGQSYTLKGTEAPSAPGEPGFCQVSLFDGLSTSTSRVPMPSREKTQPPEFRPVTQEELEEHFGKYEPSDDAANEAGAAGVPMPTAQPQMAPTRTPAGEPYKNSQAQTRQDVMDCVHAPQAAAPLAFECTMKSVDPATTSTTKHPDFASSPAAPPGSASAPTGTPSPSQPEEKPSDLCALHPDIVACAKFGTQPQADPMPRKSLPLAFATEALGLPAACPSPIPLPNGQAMSYQPVCDTVLSLRPLVVAFGALASMLIVVSALRAS